MQNTQLRRGISRRVPRGYSEKMTMSRKMLNNKSDEAIQNSRWAKFARGLTFLIPAGVLSLFKMKDAGIQQAWREKVALCFLFAIASMILVWLTLFLQPTLCPESDNANLQSLDLVARGGDFYAVKGLTVLASDIPDARFNDADRLKASVKIDSVELMNRLYPFCQDISSFNALLNPPKEKKLVKAPDFWDVNLFTNGDPSFSRVTMSWEAVQTNKFLDKDRSLFVLNGAVLDLTDYLTANLNSNDALDHAIRLFTNTKSSPAQPDIPKDATRYFNDNAELKAATPCMQTLYRVGFVTKYSLRCGLSSMILGTGLIVITLIIALRFFMALLFAWVLEPRLVASGRAYDPVTVLLVTCYSEGKEGLQTTLESLANTTYPDDKKVIFIVADGLIVGDGKPLTTPQVALSLLEISEQYQNVIPKSYLAVAQGSKRHNKAQVYPGFYNSQSGKRIAAILIVKCGTDEEQDQAKPGNRGKRDSQIMLMSFFSRIFFNERVTPFDYDLFRKIKKITGFTADKFEIILMVDADTFVLPDSLEKLINAVMKDNRIMGLCGETRISNKKESWVTAIQVFEYFISHHLGKAFESVFGGVSCLPGCFCMYRIKAPKKIDNKEVWVPILANKDVVDQYSTNKVNTLHEKNLLLLGEDRFLTTLMLKHFPTRKLVFVPSAKCRTEVPNSYKVLNSQRRRWINSTIHNLLELMMVNELCGVFCCSMRFVVFLDLIGTITLPTAICLTYYTIYGFVWDMMNGKTQGIVPYIPMISLVVILFSPALLIMLTTFKFVYVFWMFIYLIIGLPVWNFLLPLYAWWHFDDFSWGQTRQIEGKDVGHVEGGDFNEKDIPMRRIAEWLKSGKSRKSMKSMHSVQMGNSSGSDTLYSPNSASPSKQQEYEMRNMQQYPVHPSYYSPQQGYYPPQPQQPQYYQHQQPKYQWE